MGFCEVWNKFYTPEHLAHTNNCKYYKHNPIDALRHNPKGHTPKKTTVAPEQDKNQMIIFDFLGGNTC